MKKSIKILTFSILSILLLGIAIVVIYNNYKQREIEKQYEAKFDKFASYIYPYCVEIANNSNSYVQMEISLMYDYFYNHKSHYINDMVEYYNVKGYFFMKDNYKIQKNLEYASMIMASRAYGPINNTIKSRFKERDAFNGLLESAFLLTRINVYENKEEIKKIEDELTKLNEIIQTNLDNLSKYKTNIKQDLNSIKESEYKLESY